MRDRIRGKRLLRPPRTYLKNLATLLPASGVFCGAILLGIGGFLSMGLMFAALSITCTAIYLHSRKDDHPAKHFGSFVRAFAFMAAGTVFFLVLDLWIRWGQ